VAIGRKLLLAKRDEIPTKTNTCKNVNVCQEHLQLYSRHILKWSVGLGTEKGRCERNYLLQKCAENKIEDFTPLNSRVEVVLGTHSQISLLLRC
jgi:hypothetical protein